MKVLARPQLSLSWLVTCAPSCTVLPMPGAAGAKLSCATGGAPPQLEALTLRSLAALARPVLSVTTSRAT